MNNIHYNDITLVIIRAPGYAGATWFNLQVGTHPEVMSLSTPERIWRLQSEEAEDACFEHGNKCTFWPEFVRTWDRSANFFYQLAEYSGQQIFVLNYPGRELWEKHIQDAGFSLRYIKLVRDGRANLHSYLRHHFNGRREPLLSAIEDWLIPKWKEIDNLVPRDSSISILQRYEDAINSPKKSLLSIGNLLGLSYPVKNKKYWEYEHHLTAGNTGVIDLLRRLKGKEGLVHNRSSYYAKSADYLRENPGAILIDNSWQSEMTSYDRLAFDCVAGSYNAEYGYSRDCFDDSEIKDFMKNYSLKLRYSREWVANNRDQNHVADKNYSKSPWRRLLQRFLRHRQIGIKG